ncbi:nucleotidyltransferase substrate binding protein, HI0074 family [Rhodothermus marinus SG0.5JP17-172]|jgi:nucleotidyltransferase substrate binding protein (TIGR01987 family)|uniref:HI0074 family nucleotidyltransferase substrate-binding subunit n=1 Tax=Rhodothermus marinus TaxID=29549 RepID=UPI000223DA5B|nr:HI0074 family nucleotidyltransferase substrate-binding subunit [Rhodothermus marinus]AEN72496.1 nucleotidyltransferase substrate binding protein, HI0074 family [Rhodothermus marinus SG0.5JP17-172]
MELNRVQERLAVARRAVRTLQAVLQVQPVTDIVRDAAIQRFEYSFETTWKAAQHFLRVFEAIEAASPRQVIRAAFQAGLLDEPEARQALAMLQDRNMTVHTYNEALARTLFARLQDYAALMDRWLQRMETRLNTSFL